MTHIKLRSLAKGAASFVVPAVRSTHQPGGTASARHCFDLFMRHFGALTPWLPDGPPPVMAELGPGSSLGVGLAALLAGVSRYIGLDVEEHRAVESDRQVLRDLVPLFEARAGFAARTEYDQPFFPPPPDRTVWAGLEARLDRNLARDAVDRIEADLVTRRGRLAFLAPWTDQDVLPAASVDWLMSHSVMEHVDDLAVTYASIAHWLKPGGFATHLVDYQSHGLTSDWNGHWTVHPGTWALMRGRRPYLINRMWRSHHVGLMQAAGFEILSELTFRRDGGAPRSAFRPPFDAMPDGDERVGMSFFVTRRMS